MIRIVKGQNYRHSLQHRYRPGPQVDYFNDLELLFDPVNNFMHLQVYNKTRVLSVNSLEFTFHTIEKLKQP